MSRLVAMPPADAIMMMGGLTSLKLRTWRGWCLGDESSRLAHVDVKMGSRPRVGDVGARKFIGGEARINYPGAKLQTARAFSWRWND